MKRELGQGILDTCQVKCLYYIFSKYSNILTFSFEIPFANLFAGKKILILAKIK
jgi:hypothetical protein